MNPKKPKKDPRFFTFSSRDIERSGAPERAEKRLVEHNCSFWQKSSDISMHSWFLLIFVRYALEAKFTPKVEKIMKLLNILLIPTSILLLIINEHHYPIRGLSPYISKKEPELNVSEQPQNHPIVYLGIN